MNRGGFSFQRLLGISAAKAKLSRKVGFPLFSRQAQYAWLGRLVVRMVTGGRR
jgi:hypothetical protein